MAQPTRSDDQVVRRRLSHNNLRRKKWRRRQPRAERKRPRRSGNFSALTFGVLVEHPIFFIPVFSPSPQVAARPTRDTRAGQPTKRGRHTPGRRARRQSALANRTTRNPPMKGGILYGEEGEGRKEKGGEEEITPPLGEKGARCVPFFMYGGPAEAGLHQSIAAWFRPRSVRCGSHPTAEYDRRPRCRSPRGQTRCSARRGAVAVNA